VTKHIAQKGKNKGNLVTCRAKDATSCPLKNPDGTPSRHFATDEEYYDWCKDNGNAFNVTAKSNMNEFRKRVKTLPVEKLTEMVKNPDASDEDLIMTIIHK